MRKLPTILAFSFVVITLWRVAQFADNRMGAGWLGWVFSIGMGAGVFITSYYTRDNVTRQDGKADQRDKNVKVWGWTGLAFFVVVDAVFNMLEVWLSVDPTALEMQAATLLYGAFPTLAAALLGALQGHIDRLPKPPVNANRDVLGAIRKAVVAWIDSKTLAEPQEVKEVKVKTLAPVAPVIALPQEATQEKPQEAKETTKKEQALTLHRQYPAMSQEQIAQQVGVSRQRVGQYLNGKAHA